MRYKDFSIESSLHNNNIKKITDQKLSLWNTRSNQYEAKSKNSTAYNPNKTRESPNFHDTPANVEHTIKTIVQICHI